MRSTPHHIKDYSYIVDIQTRWNDNDIYGHINNAVYYTWFDSCVNSFLIKKGLLDIGKSKTIGLVVHTGCQYFAPLSYPQNLRLGLCAGKIGTSSVHYEIAVFGQGETLASAQGHFVHVYVDAHTRKPQPLSPDMRQVLTGISKRG